MGSKMIGGEGENSPRLGDRCLGVAAMSSPIIPMPRCFLMGQVALRVLATAVTLAAMVFLLVSHQSIVFGPGMVFEARFTDATALKYKFIADITGCIGSVLSLIVVLLLIRPNPTINNYFVLFLHDGGIALLLGTAVAAATTLGLVSRNGMAKVGWEGFCDNVPLFCSKVTLSIGCCYVAFFVYCILAILSVYRLKASVAAINCNHQQEKEGI